VNKGEEVNLLQALVGEKGGDNVKWVEVEKEAFYKKKKEGSVIAWGGGGQQQLNSKASLGRAFHTCRGDSDR